jgi:antitoxin component of MazEF toxin-antitoxin module
MSNIIRARKDGGSVRITLPYQIAKTLNIEVGNFLGIDVIDNRIVLSPVHMSIS